MPQTVADKPAANRRAAKSALKAPYDNSLSKSANGAAGYAFTQRPESAGVVRWSAGQAK